MAVFSLELEIAGLQRDSQVAVRSFTQVDRAARNVDRSVRGIDGGLNQAGRAAATTGRAFVGLNRDLRTFDATAARGGATIRGLIGGFVGLQALRGATQVLGGFERRINIIGQVSGASVADLGRLRDAALDLSRSPLFTPRQRAGGLEELVRAGQDARQAIGTLPDAIDLAVTAELDLSRSSQILVTSMAQFSDEALTSTRAVDTLTAVASNSKTTVDTLAESLKFAGNVAGPLGQRFGDVAAALGAIGQRGLTGGIAGRGFQSFLSSLVDPSDEALRTFERLGLVAEQLNPAFAPLPEIIQRLSDANLSATDSATIFTAAGLRVANILTGMGEEYERLRGITAASTGVTSRFASVLGDDLQGRIAGLRGEFEKLLVAGGDEGLLGELKRGVSTVTDFIRGISDGEDSVQGIATAVRIAGTAFAGLLALRIATFAVESARSLGTLLSATRRLATGLNTLPALLSGGGTGTLVGALRAIPAAVAGTVGLVGTAVGGVVLAVQRDIDSLNASAERTIASVRARSAEVGELFTDALGDALADIQGTRFEAAGQTIVTGLLGDPDKLEADVRESVGRIVSIIDEQRKFIAESDGAFRDPLNQGAGFVTPTFAQDLQAEFETLVEAGGETGERIGKAIVDRLVQEAEGRNFADQFAANIGASLSNAIGIANRRIEETQRLEQERAEALDAVVARVRELDRQSRSATTIIPGVDDDGARILREIGRDLQAAGADARTFSTQLDEAREALKRIDDQRRSQAENAARTSLIGQTAAVEGEIDLIRRAIAGEVDLERERNARSAQSSAIADVERELGTVSADLAGEIERLVAATREQYDVERQLEQQQQAQRQAQEEARRNAEREEQARRSSIQSIEGLIESTRRESELLRLTNTEREKRVRLFQLEDSARSGNLGDSEIANLRAQLDVSENLLRVERERAAITSGGQFVADIQQETSLLRLSNEEREKRLEQIQLERQLAEAGVGGADRNALVTDLQAAQASRSAVREAVRQQQEELQRFRQEVEDFSQGIGRAIGGSIVDGFRSNDLNGALQSLGQRIQDVLFDIAADRISNSISDLIKDGFDDTQSQNAIKGITSQTTSQTGSVSIADQVKPSGSKPSDSDLASALNAQQVTITATNVTVNGANVAGGAGGPGGGGLADLIGAATNTPSSTGGGDPFAGINLTQLGNGTQPLAAPGADPFGGVNLAQLGGSQTPLAGPGTEGGLLSLLGSSQGLGALLGGVGGAASLAGGLSSGNNQQTGQGIGQLLGLGVGLLFPGVGTLLGPLLGGLLGGAVGGFFAKGDAFIGGRPMKRFANGGLPNGRQLFPINGGQQVGVMNELDQEAIFPITRDSQGRLAVHAVGGDGGGRRGGGDMNLTINFGSERAEGGFKRRPSHAADEFVSRLQTRR